MILKLFGLYNRLMGAYSIPGLSTIHIFIINQTLLPTNKYPKGDTKKVNFELISSPSRPIMLINHNNRN